MPRRQKNESLLLKDMDELQLLKMKLQERNVSFKKRMLSSIDEIFKEKIQKLERFYAEKNREIKGCAAASMALINKHMKKYEEIVGSFKKERDEFDKKFEEAVLEKKKILKMFRGIKKEVTNMTEEAESLLSSAKNERKKEVKRKGTNLIKKIRNVGYSLSDFDVLGGEVSEVI